MRTDGSLRLRDLPELDNTATLGAGALEEDLGELDLAGRLKQLDEVFVRGRPRQLAQTRLTLAPHEAHATIVIDDLRCGP